MKIQVEKISTVERKLTVEVEPERVAEELTRAYNALSQRTKLPGFRPGKVPRNVLERHYRSEVENEVLDRLVQDTFKEAVKAESIAGVAPPHLSVTEGVAEGKPIKYTAAVEVKPEFEPTGYKDLKVTRHAPEITDEVVMKELERLQEGLAELVPIEGRLDAREGDWAIIDHESTIDGQTFQGSKAEGVLVRVAKGPFAEGYIPQLIGKEVGAQAEFDDTLPSDFRLPTLAGKTAHMKATLRSLKDKKLPAIDDAFVKQVGLPGIETLDALKARVKEDVEKREREKADADYKEALVRAALESNSFVVPPALVSRTIDAMIEGATQRLVRQGLDPEDLGIDFERMRGQLQEQAVLQVRGTLLLEAIAEKEKIEVTEEDVQKEIARMANETGMPLTHLQQQMGGAAQRRMLNNRLREEKALALMASGTEPG